MCDRYRSTGLTSGYEFGYDLMEMFEVIPAVARRLVTSSTEDAGGGGFGVVVAIFRDDVCFQEHGECLRTGEEVVTMEREGICRRAPGLWILIRRKAGQSPRVRMCIGLGRSSPHECMSHTEMLYEYLQLMDFSL